MSHVIPSPSSAALARYSAPLLQIAVTLLAAYVLFPAGTFAAPATGVPAALSLLSVALGAVLTYVVPLVGASRSSWLKVIIPILTGVIASLIQFIAVGDFSTTAIAFLVLTVLNGLATKLGVEIRKDAGS